MTKEQRELARVRVLAALNGLELFGHERGNIEVFKALRKLGAEVLVGVNARDGGDAVANELTRLGFETFALPFNPQWSLQFLRKHPSMALKNPWAVLRCSRRFRQAIAAFRPTHIHLASPLVYSYVSLALAGSAVPVVYRMGDCPPFGSRFNLAIWRMSMRRTAQIVAISEFVRRSAASAGASDRKIRTIYNVAPTSSRSEGTSARAGEDGDRMSRLLYVGAVAEHKGLMPLVEAVAALASDRPAVRLDIVGGSIWDTEFRSRLMKRIGELHMEDRIRLHDQSDDPSPYYRRAAVHVAPSLWDEPLGNVVIEAKREGTPSVVFPSGGLPEMINHKVDGYVCSDRTTEALLEALRWMLADEGRLQRMRTAACADYAARFGEERFSMQWAAVYRSAATEDSVRQATEVRR